MTIEERLERLERQNSRLRWVITGMIGIAVMACATGLKVGGVEAVVGEDKAGIPDVIQARRFEVIGPEGRPIVTAGVNRDATGGVVFVNNDHGTLVVQMGAADDRRGVVWAYDRCGEPRQDIR